MNEREWISVSSAARRLGLAMRTVQRLCHEGKLRARQKNPHAKRPEYLVSVEAIEKLLVEQRERRAGVPKGAFA